MRKHGSNVAMQLYNYVGFDFLNSCLDQICDQLEVFCNCCLLLQVLYILATNVVCLFIMIWLHLLLCSVLKVILIVSQFVISVIVALQVNLVWLAILKTYHIVFFDKVNSHLTIFIILFALFRILTCLSVILSLWNYSFPTARNNYHLLAHELT